MNYKFAVIVLALLESCKSAAIRNHGSQTLDVANDSDIGTQAKKIFDANCVNCHKSEGNSSRKFDMRDFTLLRNRISKDNGRKLVNTDSPETSVLYERMIDSAEPMPQSGLLLPSDAQTVLQWIRNGAPSPKPITAMSPNAANNFAQLVEELKTSYDNRVRSIINHSCASCHSRNATAPWYSSIDPTDMIEDDMKRAVEVWDMADGFPFNGSTTKEQMIGDINLLKGSLAKNSMPPSLFLVTHPSARLNDREKRQLSGWYDYVVHRLEGGSYGYIYQHYDGKDFCLDRGGNNPENIYLNGSCLDGENQRWLYNLGDGHIKTTDDGTFCLDLDVGSEPYKRIYASRTCHDGSNQQWDLINTGNGQTRIKSKHRDSQGREYCLAGAQVLVSDNTSPIEAAPCDQAFTEWKLGL